MLRAKSLASKKLLGGKNRRYGIVMNKNIDIPGDKIAEFCRRHHISRLGVFGSALRGGFSDESSDVDILVEFEAGHTPGFAFFGMQDELTELIGRKVDLATPDFLSRYFRDTVMQEAEMLYVKN